MKRTYFKKTKKLFTGLNEEKSSGLSFSVAIVAQYVFTLLFLIAARLCGGLKEGYESKDWFLYFSYFPVFFIYKYTYFSLFIHRTCHLQLLLHILISAEPTIGKFFQMHGNSQIPAQDY